MFGRARGRQPRSRTLIAGTLLLVGMSLMPAPAAAGPPGPVTADVSVTMPSSRIAAGSDHKWFVIEIYNAGPGSASGLALSFDFSALDAGKLVPDSAQTVCPNRVWTVCDLGDRGSLAAFATLTLGVQISHVPGTTGPAGKISIAVTATTDDPHPANNVTVTDVTISGHGPDIIAQGRDAPFLGRAHPGNGVIDWVMGNNGDQTVYGLTFTVTLPPHITFDGNEDQCTYRSDRRQATCQLWNVVIPPGWSFAPNSDAGIMLTTDVTSPDAGVFTGGTVVGAAMGSALGTALPADRAAPGVATTAATTGPTPMPTTPKPTTPVPTTPTATPTATPTGPGGPEVDPGDNGFGFTVFMAAMADPSPSPAAGATLPQTGDDSAMLATLGLFTVVIGVVLAVATRRRRS